MLFSGNRRVVSPLLVLSAVFLAGVGFGFSVPWLSGSWGWLAAGMLWLQIAAYGWRSAIPRIILVFLVGMILAFRAENRRVDIEKHACTYVSGSPPIWRVVVEGEVTPRLDKGGGFYRVDFKSHIGPLPVKVVFSLPPGAEKPVPGEIWECAGWLRFQKNPEKRYRMRTLWVGGLGSARRVSPPGIRFWRRWIAEASKAMARRMEIGIRWCPEVAELNKAMLLGRRADVSWARRESFVVSGTIHVFAISGLHVMLIAHLLEGLFSALGFSVRARSLLVIAPVFLYVMLTGARPSAIRAALMAGFYYSGLFFGRRPDTIAAWALTVFTVYGLNPEMFFDVGCALSFTVMLGIAVFLRWSAELSQPAVVLWLNSLVPGWLRRCLGWVFEGYSVSLAAWVAGTPVAARLFGRFTWGGLIANVAAMRFAPLVVAFGFVGAVAGFVSVRMAAICNLIAALFTYCLLRVADLAARIPDVSFGVKRWSLLDCAAWYGIFVLVMFVLERKLPRKNDISGKWWG